MIKPRVPTILKPLPAPEPPEASNDGDASAVDAAIEEELACNICNGIDSEPSNQIILCDQCDGAFHMLCLPRPLPQVPEGEWKCHICVKIFGKKDEPSMELAVGTRLWVQDKKGLWGKAKILKSEFPSAVADEAAAETSTSSPSSSTAPMSHDAAPPDASATAEPAVGTKVRVTKPGVHYGMAGVVLKKQPRPYLGVKLDPADRSSNPSAALAVVNFRSTELVILEGGQQGPSPDAAGGAVGSTEEGGSHAASVDADGAAGAAPPPPPAPIRVRVNFTGFAAKYDEWVEVGVGRLRPWSLGPPIAEEFGDDYYIVDEILDMRQRNGRFEYFTTWEGFDKRTWEPKSCFVGPEAKARLAEFLEKRRAEAAAPTGASGGAGSSASGGPNEMGGDDGDEEDDDGVGDAPPAPLAASRELPQGFNKRGARARGRFRCEPTPPLTMLGQAPPLPESRYWVYVARNHPVADRERTFIPWLGDEETDREKAQEVEAMSRRTKPQAASTGAADDSDEVPAHTDAIATDGDAPPPTHDQMAEEGADGDTGTAVLAQQAEQPADASLDAPPTTGPELPANHVNTIEPLPSDRSALSSLFCRRCFTYECTLHGIAQPRPRWQYAPLTYPKRDGASDGSTAVPGASVDADSPASAISCQPSSSRSSSKKKARKEAPNVDDAFAPLADFILSANAPPAGGDAAVRCTCKLAPRMDTVKAATKEEAWPHAPKEEKTDEDGHEKEVEAAGSVFALRGPKGQGLTALDLRRRLKGAPHRELFGTMCDHSGPCDTSNPACVCISKSNFCEAFCACGPACKNRYKGCKCTKDCGTKICPCYALGRECDADLCGCPAQQYAEAAACDACMPSAEKGKKRPRSRKAPMLVAEGEDGQTMAAAGIDEEEADENDAMAVAGSAEAEGEEGEEGGGSSGHGGGREQQQADADGADAATPDVSAEAGSSSTASAMAAVPARVCRNMGIQRRGQVPLLIGPSRVAGWGAFAPRDIPKNQFLVDYTGELISHQEADRRGQVYDRRASSYLFNLNDRQVVDAGRKGNRSRFANHSDSANASARILTVRGDHHIGIFAKRKIERGEEITFDYRYEDEERQMYGFKTGRSRKQPRLTPH